MPPKRRYQNLKELLHLYLNLYYKEVRERPIIRLDPERHTKLVMQINYDYKEELRAGPGQFDFEESKDKLLDAIELRTQFQAKEREVKEKKERNRKMFEVVKK